MRCVSKCFVSGKSLRVYSLLILGMVFGFSLSTIIQTFDVGNSLRTTELKDRQTAGHREARPGNKVAFSNLQGRREAREEEPAGMEFGDYAYERDPEASYHKSGKEDESAEQAPVGAVGDHRNPAPPMAASMSPPSISALPVGVKMKYESESWQGRNMMEANEGGLPPDKLSDELSTRQTLLVGVVTSVTQLMTQTLAIQGTWAPQATQVIYFVGEVDVMPHLPHGMEVVELEGVDDLMGTWELKEISVVKFLIDHYLEHVDWFAIVSDESYLVTENLERLLNKLDARFPAYIGQAGEVSSNGKNLLCKRHPGVLYSRTLVEGLRPYLPMCWPGGQGEEDSLAGCLSVMGVRCTQAKETRELFVSEAKHIVESPSLFSNTELGKAVAVHPVQFPKYMYRLHSFFKELDYNASIQRAKVAENTMHSTQPFIPAHLRSPFRIHPPTTPTAPPTTTTPPPKSEGGVVVRNRYTPKNKFEINSWEYFNQTRLMTIMNESPARGIIGGIREEARFALTKAIYQANQGVPQAQRYVFDKLENGYHRVDPMRGSEFILDFVFRKQSNRNARIKKRLSILRPFHETIIPLETSEMLPTVNFLVTLSGLSNRLEHFLMQYEKNVLQLGEDATLTIVLFESPDAPKVRLMVQQYLTRYQGAQMTVIDIQGEFTRGVGLHQGLTKFAKDQLVFIVDVDLDISTDFLQRCRLNTVHNKMVYFPVFFKLYNQEFVNRYHRGNQSLMISRHRGHWAHYSYGMVCIYAGDYLKSGGFDISMRGWGEEDVDLLNKVLKSGLEVFRAPDPGLIHNWHSKMCNKDKLSAAAFEHCLQSKGENLADRIELAQYVFENELKMGIAL